jgi:hypothetical protein
MRLNDFTGGHGTGAGELCEERILDHCPAIAAGDRHHPGKVGAAIPGGQVFQGAQRGCGRDRGRAISRRRPSHRAAADVAFEVALLMGRRRRVIQGCGSMLAVTPRLVRVYVVQFPLDRWEIVLGRSRLLPLRIMPRSAGQCRSYARLLPGSEHSRRLRVAQAGAAVRPANRRCVERLAVGVGSRPFIWR